MSRKTQWLKPKYVIGIIKQSKPIQLQGRTKKASFFSDVRPHKLGDKLTKPKSNCYQSVVWGRCNKAFYTYNAKIVNTMGAA
jgi:hypothetical protein